MADGSQYASVYQKISRQFPNCQAWTSSLRNLPTAGGYVNGYVNGGLHSTLQTVYTGTASYLASPLPPVFVGAPMEKHNSAAKSPFFQSGFEVLCLTAIAPIQRVKLLIQCQDEMIKSGRLSKPYRGIVDCFARTISNEGFLSLWRGNIPNVIHFYSNRVISIGLSTYFMTISNYMEDNNGRWKSFFRSFAAGCFVVVATDFVSYPLDYARIRLANDIKTSNKIEERQFNGLVDVYRKTLRSDGIAGLYRGCPIFCAKSILNHGLFVVIHAFFEPIVLLRLLGLQNNIVARKVMMDGGTVVCRNVATYPMDTVNRRMMMTSVEVKKYGSSIHAFSEIIKNEGVESLYKGVGASILQTFAISAIFFVCNEAVKSYVSTKKKKSAAKGVSIMKNESADGDQSTSILTIKWRSGRKD